MAPSAGDDKNEADLIPKNEAGAVRSGIFTFFAEASE
jgi:hypothetical protein